MHQPEFVGNANCFPTGTCCVLPPLRKSPAAAAEWAKPKEIRRGTSVEAPEGASGCRTAVSDNFNTLTPKLLSGGTRATRPTGPPRSGALGYRKTQTKIVFSGPTMRISRGPQVIRRCNSPAAVGGDFLRKYVHIPPDDAQDPSQERNLDLGGTTSASRPRRVAKNDILQNPSEDVTFSRFRTVRQTLRPAMNESSAADSGSFSKINTLTMRI